MCTEFGGFFQNTLQMFESLRNIIIPQGKKRMEIHGGYENQLKSIATK